MTDLTFNGRSDDGSYIDLLDDDGNEFRLELSEEVRAAILQPRLVSVPSANQEEEVQVTVKEIQARLRAGESMPDIAASTEWSVEKIEKFAGPILQERAYIISLALKTPLRKDPYSPTLEMATISQLSPRGVEVDEIEWNTARRSDGTWVIDLRYPNRDGDGTATWVFDLQRQSLSALDDGSRWIGGEERPNRPKVPSHGMIRQNEPAPYLPPTPAPKLVAVKEPSQREIPEQVDERPASVAELREIEADAKKDGVTKRVRIPSWEDIMFGDRREGVDGEEPYAE